LKEISGLKADSAIKRKFGLVQSRRQHVSVAYVNPHAISPLRLEAFS